MVSVTEQRSIVQARGSGLMDGPITAARGSNASWVRRYARGLAVTDAIVVIFALFGTQFAWFDSTWASLAVGTVSQAMVSYSVVSLVLAAFWLFSLWAIGSRSYRTVGGGTVEYRQVIDATLRLFAIVAIVAYLAKLPIARGYILTALPLGLLLLLFFRFLWRQWLNAMRESGEFSDRVLLVGSEATALPLARELARRPHAGYRVVGACIATGQVAGELGETGVPVFGRVDRLLDAVAATHADTVIITGSDELPPDRVRELSWALEPGRQHLVMAPSLVDVSGPRLHSRPVAGLPLVHVETPRYEGWKLFSKRAFDVLASGALIAVLSPALLAVAMIVRLSTPGPVLFRQERVGRGGRRFNMLKFRSMVVDAEEQLKGLLDLERGEGNTVLFKMANDPRVTPIGRFLRRYSLDELPQLFNVFAGSMSLVGPRPPLPREVAEYETHVHRRFLVKPGITGLWQVSGRSHLTWEESVRLDLFYVENWSLTNDIVILLKTAKAVATPSGAY